jgi:hypothetical protein
MGFNDRLAELQGDAPSWAQEDTGGGGDTGAVDIEMGAAKTNKKKQKKTAAGETSSTNLAWAYLQLMLMHVTAAGRKGERISAALVSLHSNLVPLQLQ